MVLYVEFLLMQNIPYICYHTHTRTQFCYHGLMVSHTRHGFMFKSQLNSALIFPVLIHKAAASRPSLVSDLCLSCEFSVCMLPGHQPDAHIHMSAASPVCCFGLDSLKVRIPPLPGGFHETGLRKAGSTVFPLEMKCYLSES